MLKLAFAWHTRSSQAACCGGIPASILQQDGGSTRVEGMPMCNIIYLKRHAHQLLIHDRTAIRLKYKPRCFVVQYHLIKHRPATTSATHFWQQPSNRFRRERLTASKQPTSRLAAHGTPRRQLCRSPSVSCHGDKSNMNFTAAMHQADTGLTVTNTTYTDSLCSSCRATNRDVQKS